MTYRRENHDSIDGCYNIICKLHKIFEVDTRIISLININHAYIGAFDEAKADIKKTASRVEYKNNG